MSLPRFGNSWPSRRDAVTKPAPLFNRLALIGVGLIGSSIARAARALGAVEKSSRVRAPRADAATHRAAWASSTKSLRQPPPQSPAPIWSSSAFRSAYAAKSPSEIGAASQSRRDGLRRRLGRRARSFATWRRTSGGVDFIPAHPVAGTEHSGPDAGFAELFVNRWCILTPPKDADPSAVERLGAFWKAFGANVEIMSAEHHDLVLAITSHVPHLIAYTIVGTAIDLRRVTRMGNPQILRQRFPRLHPYRGVRPDDVARYFPAQQGSRARSARHASTRTWRR